MWINCVKSTMSRLECEVTLLFSLYRSWQKRAAAGCDADGERRTAWTVQPEEMKNVVFVQVPARTDQSFKRTLNVGELDDWNTAILTSKSLLSPPNFRMTVLTLTVPPGYLHCLIHVKRSAVSLATGFTDANPAKSFQVSVCFNERRDK